MHETDTTLTAPCIALLNKEKTFFFFHKIREQEGVAGPVLGSWYQRGGGELWGNGEGG
jgi:hypothetical protein